MKILLKRFAIIVGITADAKDSAKQGNTVNSDTFITTSIAISF